MRITLMILLATLAAACSQPTVGSPTVEMHSDDYNKIFFDPALRGKTDRIVNALQEDGMKS